MRGGADIGTSRHRYGCKMADARLLRAPAELVAPLRDLRPTHDCDFVSQGTAHLALMRFTAVDGLNLREAQMDSRIARPLIGLIAGTFAVLVVDRFLFPGTLVHGFIGVLAASAALAFVNRS